MSAQIPDAEDTKILLPQLKKLYATLGLCFLILFVRLWYLQIIEGEELADFSKRNRVKETKIPSPRGLIVDRNNDVLVENLLGYEVTITPQYATQLEQTAQYVESILHIPASKIIAKVKKGRRTDGPFRPVKIKENLSRDEVFRLKLRRYNQPGLDIQEVIVRNYPLKDNGAQLFGYVGEISKQQLPKYNRNREGRLRLQQGDVIGKSGLEKTLEDSIRGIDGATFLQVDARGRETKTRTLRMLETIDRKLETIPGKNVMLTIDRDVQEAAFAAMAKRDDPIGPRVGALVALRPDGEVLAWVSTPSYDPNQFATGIQSETWSQLINDPYKPLRNKVVQDHAAPGSTFKAVVALAALQEKVITANTTHYCPGFIKFGRRVYHCHSEHGHGNVNLFQALEMSCNIYFYKLGMALGIDRIAKYARALGMGEPSGVDVDRDNERSGTIPTTEWKKKELGEEWQPGESLSNAIGQGFVLATPIQMAITFASIATEGKVHQPFVVKEIRDPITHKPIENYQAHGPKLIRDLTQTNDSDVTIDPENFKLVKEGLRRVSNGERGTAKWYKVPGIQMAGKTGTGQLMSFTADQIYAKCNMRPFNLRHHGWFVGYAPADEPKIIVAVLAEHSCAGSSGAAPVARDVIQAFFEKYHPEMLAPKQAGRAVTQKSQPLPPVIPEGD